jgi:hypothetical protein
MMTARIVPALVLLVVTGGPLYSQIGAPVLNDINAMPWTELSPRLRIKAIVGQIGSFALGEFDGVAGLEQALLQRPELFVRTLTEKLFTFALGRPPEEFDAPAIRKIVRDARADDYRFSSLIRGVATSLPFRMRRGE